MPSNKYWIANIAQEYLWIYIACIIQALCVAGEFEPATEYRGPIIRTLDGEWKSIKPRQLGDLWNVAILFFKKNEMKYDIHQIWNIIVKNVLEYKISQMNYMT